MIVYNYFKIKPNYKYRNKIVSKAKKQILYRAYNKLKNIID